MKKGDWLPLQSSIEIECCGCGLKHLYEYRVYKRHPQWRATPIKAASQPAESKCPKPLELNMKAASPQAVSAEQLWPECKEFYELMQGYRHAPVVDQMRTISAYQQVKMWIRTQASHRTEALDRERDRLAEANHRLVEDCINLAKGANSMEEQLRQAREWPIEMAKVTGLGNAATPQETSDHYVEVFNQAKEWKSRLEAAEKALRELVNLTDQGREGGLILSRADRKPLTNGDQDIIDKAYIAADVVLGRVRDDSAN